MKRFKNILVAVESAGEVYPALEHAGRLAEESGATLKIVDTVREFPWLARTLMPDYEHVAELLEREMAERLEDLAAPLRERGLTVTTRPLRGKLSIEITREVLRGQHDLVIKATKGIHSRREGAFGATGMSLLRLCPAAVWLVQPHQRDGQQRVLAAVDASPHDATHDQLNRLILELATSFRNTGCRLSVVYAWTVFGADLLRWKMTHEDFLELGRASQAEHRRSYATLLEQHGMKVDDQDVYLEQGEASQIIPRIANDQGIDLVIMGTVARTGVAGAVMGNTAEAILQRITCSVLALKPEGFTTPVELDDD